MDALPTDLLHLLAAVEPVLYLCGRRYLAAFAEKYPHLARVCAAIRADDGDKLALELENISIAPESIDLSCTDPAETAQFYIFCAVRADAVNCYALLRRTYHMIIPDDHVCEHALSYGNVNLVLFYITEVRLIYYPSNLKGSRLSKSEYFMCLKHIHMMRPQNVNLDYHIRAAIRFYIHDFITYAIAAGAKFQRVTESDICSCYDRIHDSVDHDAQSRFELMKDFITRYKKTSVDGAHLARLITMATARRDQAMIDFLSG